MGRTFRRVFATCGTVGTRSRAIRGSTSDDRVGCSASDGRCAPARPALQGAACLDASFAVSAMRARECRLYSALSIIAPSVNVLRRTRRKPSTIRGAAPDVVIGQSTAARTGAHPYRAGKVARSYHSCSAKPLPENGTKASRKREISGIAATLPARLLEA